jgi:hypothetical protein
MGPVLFPEQEGNGPKQGRKSGSDHDERRLSGSRHEAIAFGQGMGGDQVKKVVLLAAEILGGSGENQSEAGCR